MRAGDRVTVATRESDGGHAYAETARAAFAALDVLAAFIEMGRFTESVDLHLLQMSRQLGADALLIGAYRHGVMGEEVLGGITSDVLSHAQIPVFLMR